MNNDCKHIPTKEEVSRVKATMEGYLAGLAQSPSASSYHYLTPSASSYHYLTSEAWCWQTGYEQGRSARARSQNQ